MEENEKHRDEPTYIHDSTAELAHQIFSLNAPAAHARFQHRRAVINYK